jgi:hypothetical protein
MKPWRTLASALAIALVSVSTANAAVITFDTVPVGTEPIFTVTEDGVTATFISVPGSFVVADVATQGAPDPFSGNGVFDVQGAIASLTIAFDQPMLGVAFDFGINAGFDVLVEAFLDGVPVGAESFSGTNFGPFDLGLAGFVGAPFDVIGVSRSAPDFGIDNLQFVAAPAVPEPALLLLMGTGAAGWWSIRRRHR